MRFTSVLLASFLASCASLPEFRHDGTMGTVLADSQSVAVNVAAALDELAPQVKDYLGSSNVDPLVVHVVEMDTRGSCIYDSLDRDRPKRIEINRDIPTEIQRRFTLYHELVHWYGQDSWIASLPLYLEEGVADLLACETIDAVEARHIEKGLAPGTRLDLAWLHTVTSREWQKADESQVDFLYRAGIEVVYRIGIPRLREASLAGPLTPMDVQGLLADEVDPDASSAPRPLPGPL
jgi:hypothetical protein